MTHILRFVILTCLGGASSFTFVKAQPAPLPPLARELMLRKANATSTIYTLFHPAEASRSIRDLSRHVHGAEYVCADEQVVFTVLKDRPELIRLPIQARGKSIVLELYHAEIFQPDYRLRTSGGFHSSGETEMVFYRGIVEHDPHSIAVVSILNGEIRVLFSTSGENIRMHRVETDQYVVYRDHDIIERPSYDCFVSEQHLVKSEEQSTSYRAIQTGNCVQIYFECDYKSYQDNGSSVPNTEAWVAALFNEVATLYENEDIPTGISEILVWTTTDPYAGINSISAVLTEFVNQTIANGYNGRLAHLLSTRNLGGGIAYVDVLCSTTHACGVSANLSTTIIPFPNYSWNVMVVAHELGHNFGSWHTHNCVWNGNNTQIDDCGSVAGDVQPCYSSDNPILPNAGTIMSYCHAVQGVGISFTLGFGPQPGALMLSKYQNATCNTGICTPPPCTQLLSPVHQATLVDVGTSISWNTVQGVNGYHITIGTAPGTGNIINNVDVGQVTIYTPVNALPFNSNIYVKVVPYNGIGSSIGCIEEYFTTEPNIAPLCTQLTFPLNGAIDVSTTADLTWTHSVGNQSGYKITMGTSPGSGDLFNLFDVGNVTTFDPGTLPANSEIYVRITPYWGGGDTNGCIEESFTTMGYVYCASAGLNQNDEWIAGVSLGAFNNSSGAQGYSNFTHLVAHVSAGGSYPVSITPGYAGQAFNEYFRIWIDLNHDGIFDNPGERVFQVGNVSGTVTGTVSIPANAYIGPTRMRVAMRFGGYSTPCQTFQWGEVEDYTVHIHCNLVSNTSDQGPGSLPWAIGCVSPGETIMFATSLNNSTIMLQNHYAHIQTPMSVVAGSSQNIRVRGNATPHAFVIAPGIDATLSGLKIIGGTSAEGNAVLNHGTLTLHNIVVEPHSGTSTSKLIKNNGMLMFQGSNLVE